MSESEKIFAVIKASLEDLNEELDYDSLRDVNDTTPIFGGDEGIDSLSLVRLIVQIEKGIGDEFGKNVALADASAMSRRSSPYRDVASLAAFVSAKLGENDD